MKTFVMGTITATTALMKNQRTIHLLHFLSMQVKHMLSVETDVAHHARKTAEAEAKAPREPIRVRHSA